MSIYRILDATEPFLRETAKPVPKITANVLKLLDNMTETMRDAEGVGLAAPQIGVPKRVIVIEVEDDLVELINPVILERSAEEIIDKEACLSVPGKFGFVKRSVSVVLEAQNREGELVQYEAEGYLARVFQHEVDHLNGILYTDIADQVYLRDDDDDDDDDYDDDDYDDVDYSDAERREDELHAIPSTSES
jgi:peptide deformylase